ncbi:Neuraminidase [Dirofilaria immitis]
MGKEMGERKLQLINIIASTFLLTAVISTLLALAIWVDNRCGMLLTTLINYIHFYQHHCRNYVSSENTP